MADLQSPCGSRQSRANHEHFFLPAYTMAECNGLDKNFVEHHKQQLQSSGVPPHFWPTIFRKLIGQVGSSVV